MNRPRSNGILLGDKRVNVKCQIIFAVVNEKPVVNEEPESYLNDNDDVKMCDWDEYIQSILQ